MGNHPGRRILIIEDEALIALLLRSMLDDLGWVVVGVSGNATSALALIEVEQPGFDAVSLDLNLDGEISTKVAAALEARGIPFIVTTGYDDPVHLAGFESRPIVKKPIVDEELAQALASLEPSPLDPGTGQSDSRRCLGLEPRR